MTMTSTARHTANCSTLTQNTAPVFEHRCLYTHDIRRKAKRWQDGFVKFHTFNNRVMIYDIPRNFIGDTHHQDGGSNGLEDGEELILERPGILVQVGERLSTQETDLSGLLAKRTPKAVDNSEDIPLPPTPILLQPRSSNAQPKTTVRWMGWTGRAQIPKESTYEQQQVATTSEDRSEQGRPTKRQRLDDEHRPLWEILKTSRPPKIRDSPAKAVASPFLGKMSEKRMIGKTSGVKMTRRNDIGNQGRLNVKEIIEIDSSTGDAQNSDYRGGVYNSSSPAKKTPQQTSQRSKNVRTEALSQGTTSIKGLAILPEPNSIAVRLSKRTAWNRSELEKVRKSSPEQAPAPFNPRTRSPSPSVSTKNHLPTLANKQDSPLITHQQQSLTTAKLAQRELTMKPLRLASTTARKTLLCQDMIRAVPAVPPPKRSSSIRSDGLDGDSPTTVTAKAGKSHLKNENPPKTKSIQPPIQISDSPPAFEIMGQRHPPQKNVPAKDSLPHPALEPLRPPIQQKRVQETRTRPAPEKPRKSNPITSLPGLPGQPAQPIGPPRHPPLHEIRTKPPTKAPTDLPSALHRPFRRYTSDTTYLSLSKEQQQQPQNHVLKAGLRRAETVTGVPAAFEAQQRGKIAERRAADNATGVRLGLGLELGPGQGIGIGEAAGIEGKKGPWTREAWDLFGWCPAEKKEVLRWDYEDVGG